MNMLVNNLHHARHIEKDAYNWSVLIGNEGDCKCVSLIS